MVLYKNKYKTFTSYIETFAIASDLENKIV